MRITMRTAFWKRLLPLLLLLGGCLTVLARPDPPAPTGRLAQVEVGMTARQVRVLVGPPARIARQVFYQGTLEQWIYERPEPGRVEVLHRLGKEAQVQTVRLQGQPRP
jgi:hypothetical protein